MEPKNVMLLGFVNRAVDYLNRHMDEDSDGKLAELKNIDLNALESELKEDLGSSLGTMKDCSVRFRSFSASRFLNRAIMSGISFSFVSVRLSSRENPSAFMS